MFVLANMWFQTLMRTFFFNIDKIVFNFISTIYDFLLTIARTSVLSQSDIIDMASRVYKLLAIFMVFKVTFSLIMYVVNPDDFTDKTKGVGKLATNIVISLGLLILTPYIFNLGYQLQTIILEDNALATLIFGDSNDNANQSSFNSAGDVMAYATMAPFFTPNLEIEDLYPCAKLTVKDGDNIVMNKECAENLKNLSDEAGDRFTAQTYENYKAGVETGNLGILFRLNAAIATNKANDKYIIDYKYLFSTVVGIVVILLLITFCMDVALRSIKLAFLQLIAPVPILSYVDPKSGKDGLFKKWYDMCFKTYLSLFLRLLALYFAVYIISRTDKMVDIVNGAYVTDCLVKIMIIIGALMFAKQFTKILEGLGIKLDGGFTLNPFKKMEEQMVGGKRLAAFTKGTIGAAGAIGASALVGTAGAIGNVKSRWHEADGAKAKAGLIFGGLTSGLSQGLKAGAKGFGGALKGEKMGKIFTNSYSQAKKSEKARFDRLAEGVGAAEVLGTKIQSRLGMRTAQERSELSSKKYKEASDMYTAARDNILAADDRTKSLNEQLKILEATSVDRESFYQKDAHGRIIAGTFDSAAYNSAIDELAAKKKSVNDAIDARVKDIMNGNDSVRDASGAVLTTNTDYVKKLKVDMEKATKEANELAATVNDEFGGAKVVSDSPKITAKGSQTAASALPATDAAQHAAAVGRYAGSGNKDSK